MSEIFVPTPVEVTVLGEKFTIREPSLKTVLIIIRDAKPLINKLMSLGSNREEALGDFLDLLAEPEVFDSFTHFLGACSDKPPSFYDKIGPSDTVVVVNALKKAVNWPLLKELFLQALPTVNKDK